MWQRTGPLLKESLRSNASELPNELWLQILRYISREQSYKLIGINRFFLEVGMNVRWGEVVIDTEYIADAMHLLRRMRWVRILKLLFFPQCFNRDPFVATRVKTVLLCLGNFTAGKRQIREPKGLNLNTLAHYFRSKHKPTHTFDDAVSSLISTLPQLSNVGELGVELWHVPSDVVTPLFQSICVSFGRNLDRLAISGYLDAYRVLVEACELLPKFEKLKTLHVELVSRPSRDGLGGGDRAILVDSVAPFVRRLAPILETLSVWGWGVRSLGVRSWASVDFSGFYDVLAVTDFPALKKLYIRMAFDQTLGQPESLKLFLLGCGTSLEDLELWLNIDPVQLDPSTEESLGTWLINFAQDEAEFFGENFTFPKLRKLDLYPSNTEAGLQALVSIIHGTVPTLVDLTIRDRYFPPNQAMVIVNTIAGYHLKQLRMNIVYLDVELLDLLVQKLPCFKKLWLSVSEVVGSDGVSTFPPLF